MLPLAQNPDPPEVNGLEPVPVASDQSSVPEEQLHSEDVLELQAFIKRKEWIQDKTKFLESSATIDVFAGIEQLPAENLDLKPSREQVAAWVEENDLIERETDQFDAGDMAKLKKFAKAATQRVLSPRDTDLIEVTLDTLIALDRLLHLLRSRSERLELLALRLDWEDEWRLGLNESQNLIRDIHEFLGSHALWSPSMLSAVEAKHHESLPLAEHSRGPNEASTSSTRHTWYRHVESLSREAASLSDRILALRQTNVIRSGKILDKLIDISQTPVPDKILDEQEKLENTCNHELDNVSGFLMNVVVQWRISSEFYVDAKQDQYVSASLQQEINDSSIQTPRPALVTEFLSRTRVLRDKYSLREILDSQGSTFPRPRHPLFPEHEANNRSIIDFLSIERRRAKDLAFLAHSCALNFKDLSCAYFKAEAVIEDTESLIFEVRKHINELKEDSVSSKPDFSSMDCLELSTNSFYVSTVPTIQTALTALGPKHEALLARLQEASAEVVLYSQLGSITERLHAAKRELQGSWDSATTEIVNATATIVTLGQIRAVWDNCLKFHEGASKLSSILLGTVSLFSESIQSNRGARASPTSQGLNTEKHLVSLDDSLGHIARSIAGLDILPDKPCVPQFTALHNSFVEFLAFVRLLAGLSNSLQERELALSALRSEMQQLQDCFLGFITAMDEHLDQILVKGDDQRADDLENAHGRKLANLQEDLDYFLSTLPARLPILVQPFKADLASPTTVPGAVQNSLAHRWELALPTEPPNLDVSHLNDAARSEINSMAAVLSNLHRTAADRTNRVPLTFAAHYLQSSLSRCGELIRSKGDRLSEFRLLFKSSVSFERLNSTCADFARFTVESNGMIAHSVDELLRLRSDLLEHSRSMPNEADSLVLDLQDKVESICQSSHDLLASMRSLEKECEGERQRQKQVLSSQSEPVGDQPTDSAPLMAIPEIAELSITEVPIGGSHETLPPPQSPVTNGPDGPLLQAGDGGALFTSSFRDSEQITPGEKSTEHFAPESALEHCRLLRNRLKLLPFLFLIDGDQNSKSSASVSQLLRSGDDLQEIAEAFSHLPHINDDRYNDAHRTVASELQSSQSVLSDLRDFSEVVGGCDGLFSDVLECLDRLQESSGNRDDCLAMLDETRSRAGVVYQRAIESRVAQWDIKCTRAELKRLSQVWSELKEMYDDAVSNAPIVSGGRSGRSSAVSSTSDYSIPSTMMGRGSPTSRRGKSHGPFLLPRTPSRPSVSTSTTALFPKKMGQRSASGPITLDALRSKSTLHNSTFSSRLRTLSTASSGDPPLPIVGSPRKGRSASAQHRRPSSPATSEASTSSYRAREWSRSPSLRSTFPRAPRTSFGQFHSPPPRPAVPRKYVANPSNRLDVAVGNVVNRLPVNVNVEAVENGWKDQSGRYWIGDSDPKLCFCRILRSQTVMVRVGGGWVEFSRFIEDHFAESFRVVNPPSAPEMPWLSASSLRNTSRPQTPERAQLLVPSFALSSPSKSDPEKSTPPLTPLQFMRRADNASHLPSTPAKSLTKGRLSHSVVSPGVVAWRP